MCLLYDIVHGHLDCPSLVEEVSFQVPTRRPHRLQVPLFYEHKQLTNYANNAVLARIPRTYNNLFDDVDPFRFSKRTFKNKIIGKIIKKL